MKTRFFILGKTEKDEVFHSALERTFSGCLSAPDAIGYYQSVKDATGEIGKAFEDSQTVVFLVEEECYNVTKKIIAKAFGLTVEENAAVLEKAVNLHADIAADSSDFAETHALLPKDARVFVSSEALYPGFAVLKGNQTIVFAPASARRASGMLANQVIPFLNAVYSCSIPTNVLLHYRAIELEKAFERLPASVSLAETKTAGLIRDYIAGSGAERFIKESQKAEERKNVPPAKYVVNVSIAASEFMGTPYSAAMSGAFFTEEKEETKIVYMAVTNREGSMVREVSSFPWERNEEFLGRCCGELCSLLAGVISDDADREPIPEEDGRKEKKQKKEKRQKDSSEKHEGKGYRIGIIILSVLICIILVFGFFFFRGHSYSVSNWLHTYFGVSRSVSDETEAPSDETAEDSAQEETSADENA